jgi:hypothetical protein
VICRFGGTTVRGRTVTVEGVDAQAVARAVREGEAIADDTAVVVRSRTPSPVHERVGCLHAEMGLRPKTALAAAGRARGLSTSHDPVIRRLLRELHDWATPAVERESQRERVADSRAETGRLRERVAETRGRLAARRDLDADTGDLDERLEAAARRLSEAETRAVAAEQTLDRKRETARTVRATLDDRMALEDALANRRREARAELVDRLRDPFASAVASAPGGPAKRPIDPFTVDTVTAGLAVARIAAFDAPVVTACGRFDDPTEASAWLNAPVVLVR